MNWKRTVRCSLLVLPFLLLAIWPAVAAAQQDIQPEGIRADANAVLYEVTENLKLKPLAAGHRVATSALMGTVNAGTALCPDWLAFYLSVTKCALTAVASDNVSLATGKGPVWGEFAVVIQDTNTTDGSELVILRGSLQGRIDLSPAVLGGVPLGTITGRWSARGVDGGPLGGVHVRGTFEGTFRLPFAHSEPAFYLGMGNSPPVPVLVAPSERSLGVPTVRLELKFVDH